MMTMTTQTTTNGQQRRTLNETIGRLDKMIDGLADAIPETIRDTLQQAVGAAVTEGVRTALLEMMSNPDLLTVLRGALSPEPTPPAQPKSPGLFATLRVAAAAAGAWSMGKLRGAGQATAKCGRTAANKLKELRQSLSGLSEARKPLLLAFAVGGVAAVVALLAPQWVAATIGGLGGACVAMAVQAGLWLRRGFGTFSVANE
jgi:hypothetical protein